MVLGQAEKIVSEKVMFSSFLVMPHMFSIYLKRPNIQQKKINHLYKVFEVQWSCTELLVPFQTIYIKF